MNQVRSWADALLSMKGEGKIYDDGNYDGKTKTILGSTGTDLYELTLQSSWLIQLNSLFLRANSITTAACWRGSTFEQIKSEESSREN
jgi:hypothetical protein